MASGTLSNPISGLAGETANVTDINRVAWSVLRALGSLRITVWGLFLAILILLVGTLAQDEETIVDVKRDYFNSWIANVPLDVFKPVTIWPAEDFGRFPYSIPFPGGATIGLVLLINLIAAKLTRFHMTAKGGKLVAGLAFCLVGATITAVVILGAHAEDGLQGEPPFSYDVLWKICQWTIWLSTLGSFAWLVFNQFQTTLGKSTVAVLAILLAAWSIAVAIYPEALRIPDPGLRIVWQMGKSLIAGGILLVGLILLFGRRGGNVLIHLSIGMLMLGQFVFGDRQIEERITLSDGEKTSMALRIDEHELAVIDASDPTKDRVIAIDQDLLYQSLRTGKKISAPEIPFQFLVKQYFENATLSDPSKNSDAKPNLATHGYGLQFMASPVVKSGGAKSKLNYPASYIEVFSHDGTKSLGTYLLAIQLNDARQVLMGQRSNLQEKVESDGTTYQLALRLRRSYKDYDITLKDVQRVDYTGSSTVRDFSSYVTFADKDGKDSLDGRIWMNNPMRYRGETFYQSEFTPKEIAGIDTTGLQVVRNAGWLMPYISCAFAALGMLAHFGGTFGRFASRFDRERRFSSASDGKPSKSSGSSKNTKTAVDKSTAMLVDSEDFWESARSARRGTQGWLLPLIVVGVVGGMFAWSARLPQSDDKTFDWYSAGSLPMQHEGRIKPLDSVARNILQALSGRSSTLVRAEAGSEKKDTKYSATEWFYSVIANDPWVMDAKAFRIDAKEVLDMFGLEAKDSGGTIGAREKVFGQTARHRYSLNQLIPKLKEFDEHTKKIVERRKADPESLRFVDQKFLELYQKLGIYQVLSSSYSTSQLPALPKDIKDDAAQKAFAQQLFREMEEVQELESRQPPGMLPPTQAADSSKPSDDVSNRWRALRPALFTAFASRVMNVGSADVSKAVMPLLDVVDSVRSRDAAAFNKAMKTYRTALNDLPVASSAMPKAEFEAWYNRFGAFNGCIAFYLIASVLAFISMIVAPQSLRRTAFWIAATVFVVHLAAIIARVYITGRAPVINLYSSAVYIGCGAVLFGLILEILFPIRIGLLVGTIIGSTSLLVAYGLDTSDTMPVLQAVLDTQFWLTTHVQCITAGYLATFVAGGLAIGAITHRAIHRNELSGDRSNAKAVEMQRILHRITYGTICFATFFSLIGTVLGGLWADDSWGRFWGWDPKENGALMIVLWNAIVLHARWDKLVRERGFALLAIGGNIVTAWSWFGTNQLGIGLHSYGFTSGVLMILTYFVFSQILIIAIGWLFTIQTTPKLPPDQPVGSWE